MSSTREQTHDTAGLEKVVADFPVGVYRTTPDGEFLYANRALADILGYESVEALTEKKPSDLYPDPRDRERWSRRLREEGLVRNVQLRLRRADGSLGWIRHTARAVEGPDGEVRCYEGVVEDATDLVELQKERDRERTTGRLLEAVAVASNATEEPEEAYRTALQEICGSKGWPIGHVYVPSEDDPKILAPTPIWYLEEPDSFAEFRTVTAAHAFPVGRGLPGRVFESRKPEWIPDVQEATNFDRAAAMKDPSVRAAFALPVLVEDEPVAVLEFFSPEVEEPDRRLLDAVEKIGIILGRVVERERIRGTVRRLNRELESRVEKRTAELRATVRELEAFTYSVSHDLRAPLRALDGFSEAVLTDYGDELDETGRDYLERIRRAAQRMGTVLDDLLRLSRISRRELEVEEVDLAELGREVARELADGMPDRDVAFSAPDTLPAEGDRRLLRIVLENLLGNAWKFTGKEGDPRVELGRTEVDGERACFVKDNGAGFEMEYVDKLFQPFQRLHRDDEFPGSGIGLATVNRIVHRHGGRAWGEGAPGEGACFYFTLSGGAADEGFRQEGA